MPLQKLQFRPGLNREKEKETKRLWNLANPEKHRSYIKAWEAKNPEKVKVKEFGDSQKCAQVTLKIKFL